MTVQHQRSNNHWGDELQEKPDGIIRIYSMNVNGINIDRRGGKFNAICAAIKEIQGDIFCAQEHNLDVTQPRVRRALYDTAQQHWQRLRLVIGTTPIQYTTSYKPGGTMMLATGDITGRILRQDQDKWGRWALQEFQGRATRKLVVITIYQVVNKHGESGLLSVERQQQVLLLQQQDTITNPRTAFRRDLHNELRAYQTKGFELLILGDFNEPFGTDVEGMELLANNLGLVNLMPTLHSSELPATYARGSTCIDYALASAPVRDALVKAGYEPFNKRITSDHRGLFLDFRAEALFGVDTPSLSRREPRMLQSWNIQQVAAYIRTKHSLLEQHNAFERSDRLTFLGNRHAFAERLDKDVVAASLAAEKQTHRIREPDWSVALAEARKRVTILTKCLSAFRTGLSMNDILQQDMQRMNVPFVLPTTKAACSISLREAKGQVRRLVQQSYERRDAERDERIKLFEKSTNSIERKTLRELKRMKQTEAIRRLFRKLKQLRTSHERRGVTRLEIPLHPQDDPKTCTTWQQIDVPDDILHHLTIRNRSHFGQAHGTPFTVPPLSTSLGFDGNTIDGDDILQGEFDTTGYETQVASLINHMQQIEEIRRFPSRPTITDEEFVQKLQVWSESTTTSPSGLHLGHYKAMIGRHTHSIDAPDESLSPDYVAIRNELNQKQQEIRELHLRLLNYALERGHSYKRWQTVANTILFKDIDNVRIHRTRVIHLYEADYNMAMGIKWRVAMHQAEDLQALNQGQYGSRPHRRATDPVLLEEMQYEISRVARSPLAITSYDAMACYDRIIPSVAMLVSRKFGVPQSVTQANSSTLRQATYRIKTEIGLSETGYTHEDEKPIYGTGQGSGNSPAIWCFLSSTLFDCYDHKAHRAEYKDPTGTLSATLGMIGFVDDCGSQTNDLSGKSVDTATMLQQVSDNAQLWTNLLSASGGALELSKCSCHLMQWQFTGLGAPILVSVASSTQQPVTITDPISRVTQPIKLLSPYQSHKTLGHHKDPAGTQKAQFRALKEKSDGLTQFLWKNPLSRKEAWRFYYACYLPSVTYPLASSSMTEKQLTEVQKKAMSIIVARCGFNRNIKKEILYGPKSLGGAEFRHLYVEQGVCQVTAFIRHWRSRSTIGKMLRIAVAWIQLATGVNYSVLDQVAEDLPHMESKWFSSMRQFLCRIRGSLRLDEPTIPLTQRERDRYIMSAILYSDAFTDKEICQLNYCRLYLQAVTISDLSVTQGDRLDPSSLTGDRSHFSSTSTLVWPRQGKPNPKAWTLWRRANLIWSKPSGELRRPLGQWLHPIHDQRQQHFAYKFDRHLAIRIGSDYQVCRHISGNKYCESRGHIKWKDIPSTATPATVESTAAPLIWRVLGSTVVTPSMKTFSPSDYDEYLRSLAPWEIDLLQYAELYTDPFAICVALENGFRAVSDGSVWFKSQGSFGWVISTILGERAASGMGPVRGAQQHPYRSEATGLLSLLLFLHHLAKFTGKHEPWQGIVATDSHSALDVLWKWLPRNGSQGIEPNQSMQDPLMSEWDVLVEVYKLLKQMPGIQLEYVRGHQDRQTAYAQLSLLAQLNVDADSMAEQFQIEHGYQRPLAWLYPSTAVHLDMAQGTITSHYQDTMRSKVWGEPLNKYMRIKYKWAPSTYHKIHWNAHAQALQKSVARQTHLIKLVHDNLPTNSRVHRTDKRRQKCPSCGAAKEDRDHVIQCTGETRHLARQEMLTLIGARCDQFHTHPRLKRLLLESIEGWMGADNSFTYQVDSAAYPLELGKVIRQQNLIGWRQIFNGRYGQQWSKVQEAYYEGLAITRRTKQMTGDKWLPNIIGAVWEGWYLIWEQRNRDLHGFDERTKQDALRREAECALRDIYEVRERLEPRVRELIMGEVEDHRHRPLWVVRNWLAVHTPLVQASLKVFARNALQGVPSIRSFFRSTRES